MSPAAKTARKPSGTKGPAHTIGWRDVAPAPVLLLSGPEEYIASRARDSIRAQLRHTEPDLEITRIEASDYAAGQLEMAANPSLFGEAKLIEVTGLAAMGDEFLADAMAYVGQPADTVVVVLHHSGGTRGKRLLDTVKAAGAPVVECQPLKKDAEKIDFVTREFRTARRPIDAGAARTLVAAVGANLSELAAACSQLISDTDGQISDEVVDRYYGGRVEATAFKVADAALAGRGGLALSTLRHALATGVDPVPMVAALAMKLRTIAKVAAARGPGAQVARQLGMAPWQVEQARRDSSGWTPGALIEAIKVVADADAQVKGAAKDPVYALERAVTIISTSAGRR